MEKYNASDGSINIYDVIEAAQENNIKIEKNGKYVAVMMSKTMFDLFEMLIEREKKR